MKRIFVFAVILFGTSSVFGDTPKPAYKTIKLSLNDLAVSCKTGKQPLVDTKTDGTYVIITCE
jgi:hypothetical protein